MKVTIFGDYTKWQKAVQLLETYRKDITIIGCCDPYRFELSKQFSAAYSVQDTYDLFQAKEIDGVIVADASQKELNDFLEKQGITNYAIRSKAYFASAIGEEEVRTMVQPYGSILPELDQIEYHVVDHCNLNCAGCAHFSNLVKEPVFADFEQFSKDVARLKELFDHISTFFLLGGEPFLNPELPKYIYELRRMLPYTQITVVSNGLLVLTLKADLIKTFTDTGAKLSISNYNCLDTEKIRTFLDETGVDYEIRFNRDYFAKYLTRSRAEDIGDVFKKCPNHKCHFLGKGKVATCGQPFYIKYFNAQFNEEFSDGGAISLYEDGIDGNEILKRMAVPMETCRNCTYMVPIEWRRTEGKPDINDWLV